MATTPGTPLPEVQPTEPTQAPPAEPAPVAEMHFGVCCEHPEEDHLLGWDDPNTGQHGRACKACPCNNFRSG